MDCIGSRGVNLLKETCSVRNRIKSYRNFYFIFKVVIME